MAAIPPGAALQDTLPADSPIHFQEILLISPEITPVAVDRIELCNPAGTSLASLIPTLPILLGPADSLKLIVHLSTISVPLDTLVAPTADSPDSNFSPDPADTTAIQDTYEDTTTTSPVDSLISAEESHIDPTPLDTTAATETPLPSDPVDPQASESDPTDPQSPESDSPDSTDHQPENSDADDDTEPDSTQIGPDNPDASNSISPDSTDIPHIAPSSVIIDEILADPPPGIDGDANRDGERHTYKDEFVELLNTGSQPVALASWKLGDDDTKLSNWFTFPADAIISPGGRILLFGGGAPSGFTVPVFVDDGRIGNGLTNGGDTILLVDAAGDTVDILFGQNWKSDQSQVRTTDGTCVGHVDTSSQSIPFSPGRAIDAAASLASEQNADPATPDPDVAAAPDSLETSEPSTEPEMTPPDVALPDSTAHSDNLPDALADSTLSNEETILPDSLATASPPAADSTLVDPPLPAAALVDSTDAGVPVSGPPLADSTDVTPSAPEDAAADSTIVHTPASPDSLIVPDEPFPQTDSTATDTITAAEEPLISEQPPEPTESQPSPPDTSSAAGIEPTDNAADSTDVPNPITSPIVIDEILADPPPGIDGDANRDGERHTYKDEFVELLNTGSQPVALAGWQLGDDDTDPKNWFTFPADAIVQPGERFLLFGGGTPTGFDLPVFVDDGRIGNGLTNGGDTVLLVDATGDTVDILYGDSWKSDQSQVRTTDHTFTGHVDASSQSIPFSPGRATNAVEADASPGDAPADSTVGAQNETPPVSETETTVTPDSLESPQIDTDLEGSQFDPDPPDSTANSAGISDTPADSTVSNEETALPDSLPIPLPPPDDFTETTTVDSSLSDTTSADSTNTSSLSDTASADSTDTTTPTPDGSLDDENAATPDSLASPDESQTDDDANGVDPPPSSEQPSAPADPDDDSSVSTDSVDPNDSESVSTDSTDGAATSSVIIDEILADPPPGIDGDANRDGERHTYHDEFVELLNTGSQPVSLAGWKLGDDDTALPNWFTFPADAVIPPGGRLLLFGGGAPTGFDLPVFVDDGRIGNGLTNGGDTVFLVDAAGDTVDLLYGDAWKSDQSQVRSPDGTFTGHTSLSSSGTPFSPGIPALVADPLPDPSPKPAPPDSTEASLPSTDPIYQAQSDSAEYPPIAVVRASLIITEILADPPTGPLGDANGDGIADPYEDEFVELHNLGPPLDLSGWHLSDDDTHFESQFRFPAGTIVATGQYLVLFGGGTPIDIPAPAFVDDGRIGNGLTNTGDRILLIPPPPGDIPIILDFVDDGGGNRSLFRTEDGGYAPHDQLPGRSLFSPGRDRPLYTHFTLDSLILAPGRPPIAFPLRGHHPDGQDTVAADELLWRSFDEEILQFSADGRALPLRSGDASVIAGIPGRILARGLIRVRHPEPPPNQPPRITSIPDTAVYVDGRYHYQIRAFDPESNSLVYALSQAPSWLDLGTLTGLLSGRAPPGAIGSTKVSFQVADGQGGLDTQQFNLHILPRPVIRISELLADPPPGPAGDANGDGTRQTYADEFVELYNYGNRPVDLSGWRLGDDDVDGDSQFHFPTATLLPPGARAVLFGGGVPRSEHFFADDGRIGDGLDNRTEQIYLIDPQGPDTLARASYDLNRAPDQALVWNSNAGPPLLHTQWPGRDPFSPGRPRPLLQSLQLMPRILSLLVGERVTPRLVGLYSDGERRGLLQSPLWSSTQPHIATVNIEGEVTAADTGESTITARLDTFATSARVDVRLPLAARLRFTPTWERISLPPGRQLLFAVRPTGAEVLSYRWSLNGHPQTTTASQLARASSSLLTDTVAVQIHSRSETATRQWIISANRPPRTEPPIDTLAILGQTFSLNIPASDPDGDALLYLPERTPPGADIHPVSGKLTWTPPDTGRFHCRIRISDGYHLLLWQCYLRVLPPPAKLSSSSPHFSTSSHPNPFSSTVTITFFQPAERPLPVAVRIYDIAGQQLCTLIDAPLAPGRHTILWAGADRRGLPVAAGVYLYRVECGNHRTGGKLLFLP